jgi:cytochrome d ubiquinol oxidase subunit II
MNTIWFAILGILLIGYAVLDGMDLGIGALHLIIGKDDAERRVNFNIIGPVWAGYEVWLITAGGVMVAAFPHLYAAAFSGFYIVLNMVLWLLIMRGGSLEFRDHNPSKLWRDFWDVVFCVSSALLAVLFGAAVGNVVRGVPLDAAGNFQGSLLAALNPYAVVVGVLSLVLLSMHGANLVAAKTVGDQSDRAKAIAKKLWYGVAGLVVIATGLAFWARPDVGDNFVKSPILYILPLIALAGLVAIAVLQNRDDFGKAVYAGSALLIGLMASAGASLYPFLLPALGSTSGGLTIYNCAASKYTLETALPLIVITMAIVIGYHIYIHRVFAGTIKPGGSDEHSY